MRVCPKCAAVYREDVAFCGVDGTQLVDQVDDPVVGQTISRFRVLACIGSGGMGNVYRVEDVETGQIHALKVMAGELAANRTIVRRFELEAKSLSRVRHPNVVAVRAFGGTKEGLRFLVMEHVQGLNLKDALDRHARFPAARAASITRQLASGLSAAHAVGLVHRDLKPANVMLTSEAGFEYVKLLDFGVVYDTEGPGDTRMTRTGLLMGTPGYMAPEQALDREITASCDLYALGAILYEMLAGRRVFSDPNPVEQLVRHVKDPPPPLRDVGGLEKIAMALLEKDPADRPSSADEVVLEIDRLNSRSLRPSRQHVRSVAERDHNRRFEAHLPSSDLFAELSRDLPAPKESPRPTTNPRQGVGGLLGDLLVQMGMITPSALEEALAVQPTTKRRLGRLLVERGAITEDRLLNALSRQLGLDIWRPTAPHIHPRVLQAVPRELATQHRVLPVALKREGDTELVYLAAKDPLDEVVTSAVQANLPKNTRPVWLLAREAELERALVKNYLAQPASA